MKNDYPKLRAFLRGLSQAEREDFARSCETSLNYLRKAMSKGSRLDVKLVERIVVNSRFAVPPEELRSDVDWGVFQLEHGTRPLDAGPPARARPARAARPAVMAAA